MSALKTKLTPRENNARPGRRLSGRQLASILRKLDSAETPVERKRLRKDFMRGFYGDDRADRHA